MANRGAGAFENDLTTVAMSKGEALNETQLRSRPDLVAVDRSVYNLKALAQVHPGGTVILSAGGLDSTALFRSMHPDVDPSKSKLLQEHKVAGFTPADAKFSPSYEFESEFSKDLKKAVRAAMQGRRWYAPIGFWIRCALIAIGTLLCEYMWGCTGMFGWGAAAGVFHALIGLSIQHDASHGAVSKDANTNALLAYGADIIGNSRWIWLQQHILWHHPHTNNADLDGDALSAEPLLLFHNYPPNSKARKFFHHFQHWYMHLILAFYGPSVVWNFKYMTHGVKHSELMPPAMFGADQFLPSQLPVMFLLRLTYIARVVLAPWYFGGASLLLSFLLVPTVCGACLTFVFVLSHNFEGSRRDLATCADTVDWYKAQVEASSTYGGTVAMLLTGGLNFQIEHHCFPRMCSWHYPIIQPAVQACCKKHGVHYAYFPTLISNLQSTWKYMQKVGAIQIIKEAQKEF